MDDGPPKAIAIDPDDDHAQHVGRTADGRQFFLTAPFEPAIGGRAGNEFVALYLFDASGTLLKAKIDEFGPRAIVGLYPPGNPLPNPGRQTAHLVGDEKRRQLYEQRLRELGDVTFERIEIAPFAVKRFGSTFGLIPLSPEEGGEGWWVEVQPGNYMAFSEPWDSGLYDT